MVVGVDKLEKKITDELFALLCKVLKGYRPDYQFILEEISFVELLINKELDEQLSLTILQYYLNNKWQMNLS